MGCVLLLPLGYMCDDYNTSSSPGEHVLEYIGLLPGILGSKI